MAVDWSQFTPIKPKPTGVDWSQFTPIDFGNVQSGATTTAPMDFSGVQSESTTTAPPSAVRSILDANIAQMGPIFAGNVQRMAGEGAIEAASNPAGYLADLGEGLLRTSPIGLAYGAKEAIDAARSGQPDFGNVRSDVTSTADPSMLPGFEGMTPRARALAEAGIAQAREGGIDLQRATDALDIPEEPSLERFAKLAATSAGPTLAGLGTALATRNPTLGAAVSTAFAVPPEYGDAREQGNTVGEAMGSGIVTGAAELASERLGFSALLGTLARKIPAGKAKDAVAALERSIPGRVLTGAAVEGTSESASQAIQTAYKVAGLEREITFDEFKSDLIDSFGAGAIMGGALGGATRAIQGDGRSDEDRIRGLADQVIRTPEIEAADTGREAARQIYADAGATQPSAQAPLVNAAQQGIAQARETLGNPITEQNQPLGEVSGNRVRYTGDVAAMQAKLEAAGLPPGMRQVQDGKPVALYFPAARKAELDAVLAPVTAPVMPAAPEATTVAPDATSEAPQPRLPKMEQGNYPWRELGVPAPRKPRSKVRTSADFDPNHHDIQDFIALNGGLDAAAFKSEFGAEGTGSENNRFFGKPLFRKSGGMNPDQFRARLQEAGFLLEDTPDAPPRYTPQDAFDLVDRAMSGSPVYHPDGVDTQNAIREYEERAADEDRRQQYIDETGATPELDEEFAQRAAALDRGDLEPVYSKREQPKRPEPPKDEGIESSEISGDEADRLIADMQKRQRADMDAKADPLVEGFKAIGANPETFRTQLLPGKTVRELSEQSGTQYLGQGDDAGVRFHSVAVDQGEAGESTAKIYDDGKDVWIDVSDLKSGGGQGEAIYNMAFSFARNNGRNFIEDPSGVSDKAMYRRPVQQLSMLLKAGDADNIKPGDFLATQRPGGPNTRPINAPANRAFDPTLRENVLTAYTNALNAVPEIGEFRYDTDRAAFVDASGNPVGDADFDRLASDRRANPVREAMVRVGDQESGQRLEPAPVGRNSLKTAVLAQTLLNAEPSQRPALLDGLRRIASGSLGDSGLSRILPSKSEPSAKPKPALTRAEIDADIKRVLGTAKLLTRLINNGSVSLITKAEAIERGLGTDESLSGVKGLHDGKQGYLITDEIRPNEVAGVLLHEIGVHHSMESILGADRFARLQKAVESFAARGDKDVVRAQKAVPDDTPSQYRAHETLAYLSEQSANHSLVERMVDGTKLFLNRLGIPMSWIKAEPAAIRKIARESLLAEARRDGTVTSDGKTTRYSARPEEPAPEPKPVKASKRTPEMEEAMAKAGMPTQKGIVRKGVEWAQSKILAVKEITADEIAQSTFDRYHGIKHWEEKVGPIPDEQSPYLAARLSAGSGTSAEFALTENAVGWKDGVLQPLDGVKGLIESLEPVRGKMEDFIGWMAGNRAQRLLDEGRENNFTQADIDQLRSLNKGNEAAFAQAAEDYAAWNKALIDVAEGGGLVNPDTRAVWENPDYIPFLRQQLEGQVGSGGPTLSGQASPVKTLKGGKSALQDPMESIIQNAYRVMDAAMKNHAMLQVIDQIGSAGPIEDVSFDYKQAIIPMSQVKKVLKERGLTDQQIAQMPPDAFTGMQKMLSMVAPTAPDVVRVMRDGKTEYYRVTDPLLLRSLTAFKDRDSGAMMNVASFAKRILTASVTATPGFIIRNWIRDTGHSYVIHPDKMVPGFKAMEGTMRAFMKDPVHRALRASGAGFGTGRFNATDPGAGSRQIKRALKAKGWNIKDIDAFTDSLVNTPGKLWEMYQGLSQAAENANRWATAKRDLEQGKPVIRAMFDAKDMMDFSMQGDASVIQFLGDVVPFFNARLQGLYKLGRAGVASPQKIAAKGALMALVATAYMLNIDEDEEKKALYDALEDWDRDSSWHFWGAPEVGEDGISRRMHYRIPKPFEVGFLFSTIPERMYRAISGDDEWGKAAQRIAVGIRDQLSLGVTPENWQVFKPVAGVYANRDSFTGRDIEGMGDEGKLPWDRYDNRTSPIARAISETTGKALTAGQRALDPDAGAIGLGPKKVQYLWDQYTGSLGQYALSIADNIVRVGQAKVESSTAEKLAAATGFGPVPGQPAKKFPNETPTIGWFAKVQDGTSYERYQSAFYDLIRQGDELNKSANAREREGDIEGSQAIREENPVLMAWRKPMGKVKQQLGDFRKQMDAIRRDPDMTPEEKRAQIDEILRARNELVREKYTEYKADAKEWRQSQTEQAQ